MAVVPMELICDSIVNFLHCAWYEGAFWICVEHSVDYIRMILSLLISAHTESRPVLFLVPPPSDEAEGTQLGCCP